MVSTDNKVLGTILGNVDGITIGIEIGADLSLLYRIFYGSNDDKLEGLLLGESLGSTDGKVLDSNEGIKMGSTDGKVLGTVFGNVDGIILGIIVGIELGYLDESCNCFIDSKLESLLLQDSLGSTYGKVIVSYEMIFSNNLMSITLPLDYLKKTGIY